MAALIRLAMSSAHAADSFFFFRNDGVRKVASSLAWSMLSAGLLAVAGCGQAKDESPRTHEGTPIARHTDSTPVPGQTEPPASPGENASPAVGTTPSADAPTRTPPWRRSRPEEATVSEFTPLDLPPASTTAVPQPEATAQANSPTDPYAPLQPAMTPPTAVQPFNVQPSSVQPTAPAPTLPSLSNSINNFASSAQDSLRQNTDTFIKGLLPGTSAPSTSSNPLLRSGIVPNTMLPSTTSPTTLSPSSLAPGTTTPSSTNLGGSATPAPVDYSAAPTYATPTYPSPTVTSVESPGPVPTERSLPLQTPATEPWPTSEPPATSQAMSLSAPSPEAATEATAPTVAVPDTKAPDRDFQTVKVFYATDRAQLDLKSTPWTGYLARFYWPAGVLAIAGLMFLMARGGIWKPVTQTLAWCAAAGAIVLCVLAGMKVIRLQQTATKPGVNYGGQRGSLELGVCEVSIPPDHQVGELEAPTIFRLEIREDPTRHVVLLGAYPHNSEAFYDQLRDRVASSPRKNAFVFVHGFNTGFEEAARRTAQMAHDLKFEGAPIFYSWPSQAQLTAYTVDANNVEWTVPHLRQFLLDLAQQSGAESICLIAHSMGNRALTKALHSMSFRMERPLFQEVVLTAPDVDAEVFKRDLAPAIARTANRVTLYASSNDEALRLSKQIHGYPRAGDSGELLVVVPGIETIDVSAVDTTLVGHSYYSSNGSVVSDLICLLNDAKPASQRMGLLSRDYQGLPYWVFNAATVGLPSSLPR